MTMTRKFHPLLWLALAAVLAIPLVAGAPWTGSDFVFGAVLLSLLGAGIEVGLNLSSNWSYRLGAIAAALTGFVIVWSNMAVGIIGEPENPLNLLYVGVLAIALGGALVAKFRARGLRNAMGAAALATVVAGLVAMDAEPYILRITGLFLVGWTASALLFAKAQREGA